MRIIDKSNKRNLRCSACKYFVRNDDGTCYCNNPESKHYNQIRKYYHYCKSFDWASNIIDKNEITNCEYKNSTLMHTELKTVRRVKLCTYYSNVKRKDGKIWAHYPECTDENCPIKHPELLNN